MITHELDLCIGMEDPEKMAVIKCHDTGVKLLVRLNVCHRQKWRDVMHPLAIPAGATAVLKIAKPDKTYVLKDGEISGSGILFELTPQCFTVAGTNKSEVSVFGPDGRRVTTSTFYIEVPKECICDCEQESETYVDVMAKQIQDAKDAAEEAKTAADRAYDVAVHPPVIGENGNWHVWDFEADEYTDTGFPSSGGNMEFKESDPTVPDWAKQKEKPKYTAKEVGALPDTTPIPTVPGSLPNPNKLKFSGAVTGEYDGSKELTVNIPASVPVPATAEVGQVMRVSAVDASGKPTAWDKVDLGGYGLETVDGKLRVVSDEMQELCKTTLTEETAIVRITLPRKAKHLCVLVYPPETFEKEFYIYIYSDDVFNAELFDSTVNGIAVITAKSSLTPANKEHRYLCKLDILGGMVFCYYGAINKNYGTANWAYINPVFKIVDPDGFGSIEVRSVVSGFELPAGTTIRVLGA